VLFLLSLVANPEHAVRALQVRRRRSSSAAPSSSSESRTPATISLTVNGKLKISLRDLSAFNPRDRSRNRSSLRGKLFSLQLLSRYALGNRRASSTNIPGSSSGLEGDSSRFPSSSDSALSLSLSLSLSLLRFASALSRSPPRASERRLLRGGSSGSFQVSVLVLVLFLIIRTARDHAGIIGTRPSARIPTKN